MLKILKDGILIRIRTLLSRKEPDENINLKILVVISVEKENTDKVTLFL